MGGLGTAARAVPCKLTPASAMLRWIGPRPPGGPAPGNAADAWGTGMDDIWDENPFDLDEPQEIVLLVGSGIVGDDDELECATCGRVLGTDEEDEPDGDAGQPICGECNRARNFDAIELVEWAEDR